MSQQDKPMVTPYTSQEQFDRVFPVAHVAAQPQEPVAYRYKFKEDLQWQYTENAMQAHKLAVIVPLYTHTIAQPAVPVTDAEVAEIKSFFQQVIHGDFMADNPKDLSMALRAQAITAALLSLRGQA